MIEKLKKNHSFIWPIIGSFIIWIAISIISGSFNLDTLSSSAKLATFSMIIGFSQMLVVTSGEGAIDLSLIYIMTLCAYISTDVMKSGFLVGLIAALIVGALCGFINGSVNVFLKIPAMITTLATGYIYFSAVLVLAPRMTTLPHSTFVEFINKEVLGISMLTYISIFVAVLLGLLLYKTPYGKRLHATGQNKNVAKFAGINVSIIKLVAFTLAGILAALSGTLCGAFIGGAFQDMGQTYFLPSMAAVFVGGTAASGGKSSVAGVCFGAVMMSLMSTLLNTANLNPGTQRLILGMFLVFLLVASVGKEETGKM